MGISVGIRKAILPEDLKARVSSLSSETKELALAYLVAQHTKRNEDWNPGMFHADLACSAWESLKDWGLKFEVPDR